MMDKPRVKHVLRKNLVNIREGLSIKQSFIAKKLGCTRSSVAMWENGSLDVPVQHVVQLALLYKIGANDMLTYNKEHHCELTTYENAGRKKRDILKGTGSRIKSAMQDRQITTADLVWAMGVSNTSALRWQSEERFPNFYQYFEMSGLILVPVDDLIPFLSSEIQLELW